MPKRSAVAHPVNGDESPPAPSPEVALGRAIAVRRTELGMRRKELAAAAGLSYPYISGIERGAKSPSSAALVALARALQLTPAALWARAEAVRPVGGASRAGGTVGALGSAGATEEDALVATVRRVVRDELRASAGGEVASHGTAPGQEPTDGELTDGERAARVRADVVQAARDLLDNDQIDFDDEGDIPIRRNDVMLFIRVLDDPVSVLVFSPMLVGPPESAALLERLNELNANMHFLRFCFTHGGVVADVELFADPFVPALLVSACRAISEAAETVGPELQATFGGRLFFGDEPDAKPRRESGGYL